MEEYYTIGKMSKICNVPVRTLHYYDEIGLLIPSKKDVKSGYRYYHQSQIVQVTMIQQFKVQGFTLQEMKEQMTQHTSKVTKEAIIKKRQELKYNIEELVQLQKRMDYLLEVLQYQDGKPNIQIKKIEKTNLLFLREKGPADKNGFSKRFSKMQKVLQDSGGIACDMHLAIYYDEYQKYDSNTADIEVGVPVSVYKDNSHIREFGGFEVVSAIHYGPHHLEYKTYTLMMQWLQDTQYQICGSAIERYIIDVLVTSKEEEYITELMIPVKKS